MENIPFYDGDNIKSCLTYDLLVEAIEKALADFSKGAHGGVSQPLRATVDVTDHNGFMMAMPAYVASQRALACKLITNFPANSGRNLPSHMATIILFDEATGAIQAMMDGELITAMRTAAASAVATKYLAQRTQVLSVLGCGTQGRSHIDAFRQLFPVEKINLWNHNRSGAERLANELTSSTQMPVQIHDSVEGCVVDADVVVVATSSTVPILHDVPMKPWVHINSVGAPRPTWQELGADLMTNSTVYVDSEVSASCESGDVVLSSAHIYAEVGDVINGTKSALKQRRTIFKSLGIAVEDAVSARLVFDANQKRINSV